MPSAPDWLRKLWGGEQGVGPDKAMKFLKDAGFVEIRMGFYKPPDNHQITDEEHQAMSFLIQEWDFGGFLE